MIAIDSLRDVVHLLNQRYDVPMSQFRLMIDRDWLAEALEQMYKDMARRINNLDVRHKALHMALKDLRAAQWLQEATDPLPERAKRVANEATQLFGLTLEDVHPYFNYGNIKAVAYHKGGRFGFTLSQADATVYHDIIYGWRRVEMPVSIAVNSCQCPWCNHPPVNACETVNNHRIKWVADPIPEPFKMHVHTCPRCNLRWICIEGGQLR